MSMPEHKEAHSTNDHENILTAAQRLADAFKNSEVYRQYRRSRIRVEEKPDLAERLHHYKRIQMEFENKRLQNQPVTFEEEKHISHLYAELTLNEEVRNFLRSENQLLDLYRQAMETLESGCEIDLFAQA